jgi:precorrin-8X/cobalt-precorrin-8 methylmutase
MDYLRDPDAIYAESFAIIRREAKLDGVPLPLRDVAIRMIHACGMTDLVDDFAGEPGVVGAAQRALIEGCAVFCDCEMVRAGISAKALPAHNDLIVTLNAPEVPALAERLRTTRSAASVELWRGRLDGAVAVIGNAPTALFRLIEIIAEGGAKPAAIIATPVGFVGAAESKEALIAYHCEVPFVTLRGRRGGSAMASSAFNAIGLGIAA